MAFPVDAHKGFAEASEYGWCYKDRNGKKPKWMRKRNMDGSERKDYLLNPDLRKYTEYFFDQFGLPMPNDDMIYRGNSQDLLFLDNLGLVIRTGPIDVIDMIHPGVLQPLYWMPFDNTDHVIAIYGGIQLSAHLYENEGGVITFNKDREILVDWMKSTGQKTNDSNVDQNFGYCNNELVVLDTEEWFFGSKTEALTDYKYDAYNVYREAGLTPYLAIRQVMIEMYGDIEGFSNLIKTYDFHQPLRAQLDNAISEPDLAFRYEMLDDFYRNCRKAVDGKDNEVALYRPWTGSLSDNRPKLKL